MKLLISALLIGIFVTGCSVSTTTPKLQTVDQYGGPTRNTIKITKEEEAGDVNVRVNVSMNRDKTLNTVLDGHTLVNQAGLFEVEPMDGESYFIERAGVNILDFQGETFRWHVPEIQTNFEVEVNLSSNVSLYGGTSFSSTGKYDLNSFNFGLGFFREEGNWGIRFDVAGSVNQMTSEIEYVRIEDKEISGDETRRVYFFSESDKQKFTNLNLGLTINTKNPDWIVNGFFNYTMGHEDFFDFTASPVTFYDWLRSSNSHFQYDETYHSISLGVYKDISTLGKIIAGVGFNKYTDEEGKLFTANYFMQFDFDLF